MGKKKVRSSQGSSDGQGRESSSPRVVLTEVERRILKAGLIVKHPRAYKRLMEIAESDFLDAETVVAWFNWRGTGIRTEEELRASMRPKVSAVLSDLMLALEKKQSLTEQEKDDELVTLVGQIVDHHYREHKCAPADHGEQGQVPERAAFYQRAKECVAHVLGTTSRETFAVLGPEAGKDLPTYLGATLDELTEAVFLFFNDEHGDLRWGADLMWDMVCHRDIGSDQSLEFREWRSCVQRIVKEMEEAGLVRERTGAQTVGQPYMPRYELTAEGHVFAAGFEQPHEPFVPKDLQLSILAQLEGRALIARRLAEILAQKRSTMRDALRELMKQGLIRNRRGCGYYRPDAPPALSE